MFITPSGIAEQAFDRAFLSWKMLCSKETQSELRRVLGGDKFDRYANPSERARFLKTYFQAAALIVITDRVTDCIDPRDNKFLELALSGRANLILSGDDDLLRLHPWLGVSILSPRDFLNREP